LALIISELIRRLKRCSPHSGAGADNRDDWSGRAICRPAGTATLVNFP
jgi:hypothetical protein